LENVREECREGYGRITLRPVLEREAVMMVSGYSWLKFCPIAGFGISDVKPIVLSVVTVTVTDPWICHVHWYLVTTL